MRFIFNESESMEDEFGLHEKQNEFRSKLAGIVSIIIAVLFVLTFIMIIFK